MRSRRGAAANHGPKKIYVIEKQHGPAQSDDHLLLALGRYITGKLIKCHEYLDYVYSFHHESGVMDRARLHFPHMLVYILPIVTQSPHHSVLKATMADYQQLFGFSVVFLHP